MGGAGGGRRREAGWACEWVGGRGGEGSCWGGFEGEGEGFLVVLAVGYGEVDMQMEFWRWGIGGPWSVVFDGGVRVEECIGHFDAVWWLCGLLFAVRVGSCGRVYEMQFD